jgi:hypothetical protein
MARRLVSAEAGPEPGRVVGASGRRGRDFQDRSAGVSVHDAPFGWEGTMEVGGHVLVVLLVLFAVPTAIVAWVLRR